ncbi:hypothetical protein C0995_012987 [Termitomyces sp. Mi166|nr:hypothetical protein C0995_012987 [Termitomyces sp. Mi166\
MILTSMKTVLSDAYYTSLMFSLATTQIVIDTSTIFDAFIPLDRPNREARLANISIPINAAKRAIFFAMMILGDVIAVGVLLQSDDNSAEVSQIYRCFIVWARNWWLIVIPSICSVISAILAYMTIWATQHRKAGMFILKTPWTYGTAIFTLSLVANAIATSLVAYRIWMSERQFNRVANTRRGRLLPIARIVVESGLLNTAYLIVYITVLQVQKGKGSLPIVADMSWSQQRKGNYVWDTAVFSSCKARWTRVGLGHYYIPWWSYVVHVYLTP